MCNLLNYGSRKLCPIVLLSSDVPLTCEKYVALELLLKIDLWLHVAEDASVHYPRCFSAKWNNVLVQWLCAQRISTSSLQSSTCCALHILSSQNEWSQCRSLRPDSRVRWQICSPRGELPEGKSPQGEVHTVVIPVCLHYVRFKAAVPCLQQCQNYSCCTVSPLKNICEKGLNNIYVNQNRQCVVMMCALVWVIRCQHWMVAVKWAFCVVRLWAIKCQLFVPLLSEGDLNRCTVKDELFQTGGKLSKGSGDIMRTRRLYTGQCRCRRTVSTFHSW